jgi:nucleotide-binding universal stress UspA family protein
MVMDDLESAASPLAVRHVLLPLDGSAFALAAMPTARALSDRLGADLVTVSVASDEATAEQMRAHAVGALGGRDGDERVHVAAGEDPAEAIVARSGELSSCVVCMSTRGRGRISGTIIGSVARAVLQSSNDPVVAVGPAADRPPALVGRRRRRPAGWPEPLSVHRLVACVDGSRESETVLPVAVQWAAALDMAPSVLTVAEDALQALSGERPNQFGPPDPTGYVNGLVDRLRESAPDTDGEVVRSPLSVARGLQEHLAARPAGLVALTTHARSGFDRLRLGATSADIVRTSPVPVLAVPVREP